MCIRVPSVCCTSQLHIASPPSPSHLAHPDSDSNSNVQTMPLLATVQSVCIS